MLGVSFFNYAHTSALAHPMLVVLQFIFGAEYPAEGSTHCGGDGGLRRVAIGVDEGTVVLSVSGNKVDERLEASASSALDLDVVGGFGDAGDFAELRVELNNVNLLDAVLEEAVDCGVEVREILACDASADVDADDETRGEVVTTAHGFEARATIGTHTSKAAGLRENGGSETGEDFAIINAGTC